MDTMLVDCSACAARGPACEDCVVSMLLGAPSAVNGLHADTTEGLAVAVACDLAADERRALEALASGGLLPPLRLVQAVPAAAPYREEAGPTRLFM